MSKDLLHYFKVTLAFAMTFVKISSFKDNAEFFAMVFEIGRRHKILNPECMRTGLYTLQYKILSGMGT